MKKIYVKAITKYPQEYSLGNGTAVAFYKNSGAFVSTGLVVTGCGKLHAVAFPHLNSRVNGFGYAR